MVNLDRPRTRLLNIQGQAITVQQTSDEHKAAEAQLADAAEQPRSSFATSMSVLAHTWFTLNQTREAARLTYNRAITLRQRGREMSTAQVVQQWSQATSEIMLVEAQIVEVLHAIVAEEEEGLDAAFGLLAAAHTNMQSGIAVRLPRATQVHLALESGILQPESKDDVENPEGTLPFTGKPPPQQ